MSDKAASEPSDNGEGAVLHESGSDDVILPFVAEKAGARGRLARIGPVVDEILKAHDYPDAVSSLLGEAITLTALIGTSLKFEGKLILQTKSDGPLSMMVVDFTSPDALRAYASFDAARIAELGDQSARIETILGQGYMALTIDQGPDMERYQGIVGLETGTLGEAAARYFYQSEQIPSLVRLHVAKHYSSEGGDGAEWHWRAGGLMVQYLTSQGGIGGSGAAAALNEDQEEDWQRARILGDSVEPHELLDPQLAPEQLLYRLYHEEGVRVFKRMPLTAACTCSRERVGAMLANFSPEDRHEMVEDGGKIKVTCEFCNRVYEFTEEAFL